MFSTNFGVFHLYHCVEVLISLISQLTTHIDYICAHIRLTGLLLVLLVEAMSVIVKKKPLL